MGIKKTTFYRAKEGLPELEPVDPNDPDMVEQSDGDCCICDNPSSTGCVAESGFGSITTLAGAQLMAYWLGR